MRLIVFGGSFNPVHVGHLILAEEAIEELGADACVLVPAFKAPHKERACGASDRDRLDMLRAAVEGESRFLVDDCEIARGGVSYTVSTLEQLIQRYRPDGKPVLLIGDDLAPGFASWREPDRIAAMADIALARRTGEGPVDFPWPHVRLGNSLVEISSSRIRERLASGSSCKQSLPPGVFSLIRERGLYGYRGSPRRGVAPKASSG